MPAHYLPRILRLDPATPFCQAAVEYLTWRRPQVAARTGQLERERLTPLGRAFRDRPLASLGLEALLDYRERRIADVCNRTVNLEIGVLRRILRLAGLWSELFTEALRPLPERSTLARVLSPEEKLRLFQVAASRKRWLVAYLAGRIASSTTCRKIELRELRWESVDFARAVLLIRRSKGRTAGVRVVPLNEDAVAAFRLLEQRARQYGLFRPDCYVFPARDRDTRRLIGGRPQSWRSAWRSLTRAAGLRGLRFHDLRHQAITELSEAGIGDAVLMALAGHSSRVMLDAYTHIRMPVMREAVSRLRLAPLQLALFL